MTLGEMRTLFGNYANDPLFGYFTPSIVLTYLNNAAIQAQRRLLKMHWSYYSTCAYTTLVVGQSQYSLPDDFLAMFDLWIDLDTTDPSNTQPLELMPLSKRHGFPIENGTPTHFYMLKNSLNVLVRPDTALTLEIIYAPFIAPMVDDTDEPDVPDQFHEYIVLLAAETALMVDDRVSALVDARLKYYEDLISANEQRVQNSPRYIIEVS